MCALTEAAFVNLLSLIGPRIRAARELYKKIISDSVTQQRNKFKVSKASDV
jgi:hypothetical protein